MGLLSRSIVPLNRRGMESPSVGCTLERTVSDPRLIRPHPNCVVVRTVQAAVETAPPRLAARGLEPRLHFQP